MNNRENGHKYINVVLAQRIGGERIEEVLKKEVILVKPMVKEGEPAGKVGVTFGATVNLGNYRSARIDVGVEMPASPSMSEEAYEEYREWVLKRLVQEVESVKTELTSDDE